MLVLFRDAAGADTGILKKTSGLPVRLWLIGLPLTILLGLGVGVLLINFLSLFEIVLLATMLAPTDAALVGVFPEVLYRGQQARLLCCKVQVRIRKLGRQTPMGFPKCVIGDGWKKVMCRVISQAHWRPERGYQRVAGNIY